MPPRECMVATPSRTSTSIASTIPTCDLRITISPRDGDAQIDNNNGGDDIAVRDVRFEALTPNGRALLP